MKDLTKGNPTRLMLSFALPVCLGNIFQLFYSLADTRIVGSTLGNEALAAIGATTAITTLLIGFLQGLTNGFSIIVAQCFGAKQTDQLKKSFCRHFFIKFYHNHPFNGTCFTLPKSSAASFECATGFI